jgi:hypothetical protein
MKLDTKTKNKLIRRIREEIKGSTKNKDDNTKFWEGAVIGEKIVLDLIKNEF